MSKSKLNMIIEMERGLITQVYCNRNIKVDFQLLDHDANCTDIEDINRELSNKIDNNNYHIISGEIY